MSSRNIAVRKDVYDALRRERRARESFTKVLLRLLGQRGALAEIFGAWPSGDAAHDGRWLRRVRGAAGGRP